MAIIEVENLNLRWNIGLIAQWKYLFCSLWKSSKSSNFSHQNLSAGVGKNWKTKKRGPKTSKMVPFFNGGSMGGWGALPPLVKKLGWAYQVYSSLCFNEYKFYLQFAFDPCFPGNHIFCETKHPYCIGELSLISMQCFPLGYYTVKMIEALLDLWPLTFTSHSKSGARPLFKSFPTEFEGNRLNPLGDIHNIKPCHTYIYTFWPFLSNGFSLAM